MIREVLRALGQVLRYGVHGRRLGLVVLLVVGVVLLAAAVAISAAAPALVYPIL